MMTGRLLGHNRLRFYKSKFIAVRAGLFLLKSLKLEESSQNLFSFNLLVQVEKAVTLLPGQHQETILTFLWAGGIWRSRS